VSPRLNLIRFGDFVFEVTQIGMHRTTRKPLRWSVGHDAPPPVDCRGKSRPVVSRDGSGRLCDPRLRDLCLGILSERLGHLDL
jgi:hypothetical protein